LGKVPDHQHQEKIHRHGEEAQKHDREHDDHGGAFELLPGGPGALLELLAGLGDVGGEPRQVAFAPEHAEDDPDDRGPDGQFNIK